MSQAKTSKKESIETQDPSTTVSSKPESSATNLPTSVAKTGSVLPAVYKPSAELEAQIAEVQDNLATVENFRLPRIKMTTHGAQLIAEQDPVMVIEDAVILHAKRTNVYY